MLYQLKRNGKFDKLSGVIIGGFTETTGYRQAVWKNGIRNHPRDFSGIRLSYLFRISGVSWN
jgi:muramoyltetrapeptide carboxypeptidase LdcA involved in peptidoglycan recycling